MANDLLITAIRESGLDILEVADIAGADPRTVQRWLGGRVPHPRYRVKLAQALHLEEQQLWPETGRVRGKAALGEIAAAFPRRGDPDAPDWRALLRAAHQQVDLLGYSLADVTAAKQTVKLLSEKGGAGCAVRIAIANPNSDAVLAADAQQRPPGRLLARIRASHHHLFGLIGQTGVELRQHQVATSHTIQRFDDTMLLTVHLYGTPGLQAPVLQLRRELDYGLFDQFARHFEDVWQAAQPIGGQTAQTPASSEATDDAEREQFFDSLDRTWRPPTD